MLGSVLRHRMRGRLASHGKLAGCVLYSTKAGDSGKEYRSTLLLPQTDFPMRANAKVREPELAMQCADELYARQLRQTERPLVVLHDGPPYANGKIHMGHALNKVLKDMVCRWNILYGKRVSFVPGWDCHGLPIEMKAIQQLQATPTPTTTTTTTTTPTTTKITSKTTAATVPGSDQAKGKQPGTGTELFDGSKFSPATIRQVSKSIATQSIEDQRTAFKRLGVAADWNSPYKTMTPEYEASQLDVLRALYASGCIFRGVRPVFWSPSSRTALAESELEYPEGHKSRAVYVLLPVVQAGNGRVRFASSLFPALPEHDEDAPLHVCIWTTTPWTLPANQAVAFNKNLNYVLLKVSHADNTPFYVLVAENLFHPFVLSKNNPEYKVERVYAIGGSKLEGLWCAHPMSSPSDPSRATFPGTAPAPSPLPMIVPLIHGDYVTETSGTGLVHTAPSHGQEDFLLGQQHGLNTSFCAVDDAGKYTAETVRADELEGLSVLTDGNAKVLALLEREGRVWSTGLYEHKYAYDWRTKQPVLVRTTAQWFCSLDTLKEKAMQSALDDKLEIIPASGRARLSAFVNSRSDWCISRQRSWGVPIPVFYEISTGQAFMNEEIIDHVRSVFLKTGGSDAWWNLSVEDLLPPSLKSRAASFKKGADTLDVWFDSGSSWKYLQDSILKRDLLPAGSMSKKHAGVEKVIYCEGSDQHRGWFQSSLLTSIAVQNKAPYNVLLTHGFVLDEQGRKMSKSLGNVLDPIQVVDSFSADILRMWAASSDYSRDVLVGNEILNKVAENVRKIRNTCRFLLGNLSGFTSESLDTVLRNWSDLPFVDQWLLGKCAAVSTSVEKAYQACDFASVQSQLVAFATNDLSAFYLDCTKDRVYCNAATDVNRLSAQVCMYVALLTLMKCAAPILCHTSEEIWQHLCKTLGQSSTSLLLLDGWVHDLNARIAQVQEGSRTSAGDLVSRLQGVRESTNRALEVLRKNRVIGSSVDAHVSLTFADRKTDVWDVSHHLTEFFNVSTVSLAINSSLAQSSPALDASEDTGSSAPSAFATAEVVPNQAGTECTVQISDPEYGRVTIATALSSRCKCPRCWMRTALLEGHVCARCESVLNRK
ncbi:mitochondrial isoleucyl-tRNA synthetase (IleRS) [Andalucia godoyi]|uniref:isoleucine--tRNA ligase n=1 Tax=Andalucia godoyi TaxID=505711 RepID=A0A8K0AH21_ANDGO|nr:mitochondrial isoleucyl-tRNA synthetase (IleRS) [Andalucia godoyi]|eukprot:ANDGO_03468.mRNA.1 mitochondrial isoleucyl-tRNA synthetase (IleRS)